MEISAWLDGLGLGQYERAFRENHIDGSLLDRLTAEDLSAIGVASVGHRRRLLDAIAAQSTGADSPANLQMAAPASVQVQPERRQLTIMFVDLVGSTARSARLDPEEMSDLLRGYQNAVAGEIARYEGHVAKFMGDGVLAYFGWPRAHEDEAERAVRAALATVEAVKRLPMPGDEPLAIRIGIATGLVVVGELIGEGAASEEMVVGDTPNLAARLQTLAGPGQVVIAEGTRRLLGQHFTLERRGPLRIKGLEQPVVAFAVLGEARVDSRFDARSESRLPIVGRGDELEALLDHWRRAERREGSAILLVGEAGIGKSRLTHALMEAIAAGQHARIRYQCSPFHSNNALWPIVEQLRRAAGISDAEGIPASLDRIESLLGDVGSAALIADLIGIDGSERYGPLALTPQAKRARTLEALVRQLLALAREGPVLVVLEDAHWIDPTTADLLSDTLEHLARERVLLLITTRPDKEPRLAAHPSVTRLVLNRLPRKASVAMVEGIARGRLAEATIRGIIERTDGIPLFVEELTKALIETGDAAIPASLHDSLIARLDRSLEVKQVAQIAACIGREFDHALLSAVVAIEPGELDKSLRTLEDAELIFRRGSAPNRRYVFKHALVQDAAYNSLLKSRRQELHRHLADTLLQRFGERATTAPELLAHHYAAAGDLELAAQYWLKAAERSILRSANVEGIGYIENGLALLTRLPETRVRAARELTFQRLLGTAIMAVKGYGASEAMAAHSRALALCRLAGTDTTGDAYVATLGAFLFRITRAEHRAAAATAGDLLARAKGAGDAPAIATGHMASGIIDWHLGRFAHSHRHNLAGLALLDQHPDAEMAYRYGLHVSGVLLGYDGWALTALGRLDEARTQAERSIDELERSQHLFTYARGMFWNAVFHQIRGDWASAERLASRATQAALDQSFAMVVAVGQMTHGAAVAALGSPEDGLTEMLTGFDNYLAIGARVQLSYFHTLLADLHLRQGNRPAAANALAAALDLIEETDERFWEAEVHRSRAHLCRAGADFQGATHHLSLAIDVARRQDARWYELRAARDLAALRAEKGDRQKAHDLLAPVYDRFTEGFDTPDLIEAKALLDQLR